MISASILSMAQPGQDHNLAVQYYNSGEYEKAADLFEKLFDKDPSSAYYYRYYFNSLLNLQDYKKAEKLIKKQLKKDQNNFTYHVDLGYLYKQQGDLQQSNEEYNQAIKNAPAYKNSIIQLANTFMIYREYDNAIKAYEHGKKIISNYSFNFELANLYKAMGKDDKMLESYLLYVNSAPDQLQNTLAALQDKVQEDEFYKEMQRQLYKKIQENPNDVFFNEILIWLFAQKKDFESAFTQAKAIDRRLKENGGRIFELAKSALNEEEYDIAIEAYKYVLEKGKESRYYFEAREGLLNARKEKITSGLNYSNADLIALDKEYSDFLTEFNHNRYKAANTLRDYANIQSFYLYNLEKGIKILEELIQAPGLMPAFTAQCKLDLGDCYLIDGQVWEATLLYSQVDKQMKDAPLGELARFKNAKLSYYIGDFGWSQSQLDVLKASTSELIANDALFLSVFITSNLGLDTSTAAMEKFSRADLLFFQNKIPAAITALDSISDNYPNHILGDDIYFLKAKILLKQQKTKESVALLEKLIEEYKEELLADDALFLLANIYEKNLKDNQKAMEYYQQIIMDHPGSIFVIDARDRFRALRGDKLN